MLSKFNSMKHKTMLGVKLLYSTVSQLIVFNAFNYFLIEIMYSVTDVHHKIIEVSRGKM